MDKKVKVDASVIEQTRVDPVTFEVLRSIFEYAADRMSTVLQRASFSPILADMVDFSNAIYDCEAKLLSQAANCPIHLAAMKFSAEAIIARYPREQMQPGDVYVVNDPYQGGTHINDITFLMPIFFDGDILAFAVSRGHWMDLGGGAAGGQAFGGTHIAGEGLRLPPLKLYDQGQVREDLLAIIMNNTRTPHFVKGDLQAMPDPYGDPIGGVVLVASAPAPAGCITFGRHDVIAATAAMGSFGTLVPVALVPSG